MSEEQKSQLIAVKRITNCATWGKDGENLFKEIDYTLSRGIDCTVCFDKVNLVTCEFLNVAIGQLYSKYSSSYLQQNLHIDNLDFSDRELLRTVIDNAKEYYGHKKVDSETTTQKFKIKPEQPKPDEIHIEVAMDHDFDKPEDNIIESALKDIIDGLRGLNIGLRTILLNGTETEVPLHLWQAHAHIQKAILHLKSAHMKHTGRREF